MSFCFFSWLYIYIYIYNRILLVICTSQNHSYLYNSIFIFIKFYNFKNYDWSCSFLNRIKNYKNIQIIFVFKNFT